MTMHRHHHPFLVDPNEPNQLYVGIFFAFIFYIKQKFIFSFLQYTRPIEDIHLDSSANYQHQAQSVQNNLINATASVAIKSPTLDKNKNNASNIYNSNSINCNIQQQAKITNNAVPIGQLAKQPTQTSQLPVSPGKIIFLSKVKRNLNLDHFCRTRSRSASNISSDGNGKRKQ